MRWQKFELEDEHHGNQLKVAVIQHESRDGQQDGKTETIDHYPTNVALLCRTSAMIWLSSVCDPISESKCSGD